MALVCFGGGFTFPGGEVREVYTKSLSPNSVNYFSNDVNGNVNDGLAAVDGEYLNKKINSK